jgi:glucose/arabinose dehydrogenase
MKPANTFAKLATTVAIFFCLAAGVSAQSSPAKPAHKAKARKPAPSAPAPAGPAANAVPAATDAEKPAGPRRDPFLPLVSDKKEGGGMEHLPPGKAGLVITSVRVDGTVRSQEGMIAVLSNADQHVYFVREGDQLYDGNVDKIGLDGVTFRQNSKDAFGKPVERVVTKRIYASAGEQQ